MEEIKVRITWEHMNQAMVEALRLLGLYKELNQREGWLKFIPDKEQKED